MFVVSALIAIAVIIGCIYAFGWWGIAAIIIIYFVLGVITGKKRRSNTISTEINKLIASGHNYTVLHHIYYEAAHKFAVEQGAYASFPINDSIDYVTSIDDKYYYITFTKTGNGSTFLYVSDPNVSPKQHKDKMEMQLNELIRDEVPF